MVHDARFAPRSLESAIVANRKRVARRIKYRAVCRRLYLNFYEYQDAGKGEKAQRILDRARAMVNGAR